MPPKGWRKDSEGKYPNTSYIREQEKLSIDDLLFPKSIITSLAKGSLQNAFQNDGDRRVTVSKDAALALQRSATVFVNHLLMFARSIAKANDRKSCNEQDILAALEQIGLGSLQSIISERMQGYQQAMAWKKQNKESNSEAGYTGIQDVDIGDENDDGDEDEDEVEEDEDVDDGDDDDDDEDGNLEEIGINHNSGYSGENLSEEDNTLTGNQIDRSLSPDNGQ